MRVKSLVAAAVVSVVAVACGSKNSGPLAPDTSGPGPSGATITILANGTVSPSGVTITANQSVTFVNNDTRSHQITSNPHPEHTDCPAINAVGLLAPGQTRLTNAFSKAVSCGFHDHGDPDNNGLKGTITVQ